jgi:heme exporter protein D
MIMSFFEMGGYAGYVWPAFGATALVLAGLLLASVRSLRVQESMLAALQREVDDEGPRRRALREA